MNTRSKDPGFIKRVTELVIANLEQESFSGSELADLLYLSREQTHRKLKKSTGLSTGKFIRYIRLLKACNYLFEGENSISVISFKVGFSSPSYFNKCFKEEWGISPGEFKKSCTTLQITKSRIYSFYQLPEINAVLQAAGVNLFFSIQRKNNSKSKKLLKLVSLALTILILLISLLLINKENNTVVDFKNNPRIAILPFSNQTNDSLLDPIGEIASSWISSRIDELENFQTIPYFTINQYISHIGILPYDPENRITLGEILDVKYFISGEYYMKEKHLYFASYIRDAYSQKKISSLPLIKGPKDSVMPIIENVRLKIAGLLTNYDEIKLGKLTPPNYNAYKYYLSGLKEMKNGISAKSIELLEKSISLEPEFVMPLTYLIWRYPKQKRDSILHLINSVSYFTPYERKIYTDLKETYDRNYKESLRISLSVLEDYPQDYYFNMLAAHKAKSLFMPELAIDILSKLKGPHSNDVGLVWHYFKVWNYTESLTMLDKYEEALVYLESIPINFYNPAVMSLFINVYVKLGRSKEEIESFIERFNRSEKIFYALNYTAAAYEFGLISKNETSRYFANKAIRVFESIPEEKDLRYDLVDALYLSGDFIKTRFYLKQRLIENPSNDDLLIYLAQVEASLGNTSEVEKIFSQYKDQSLIKWRRHNYDFQNDYLKARLYAHLGEKAKATALLQSALSKGQLRQFYDFERDIFLKPLFDYPHFLALVRPKKHEMSQ